MVSSAGSHLSAVRSVSVVMYRSDVSLVLGGATASIFHRYRIHSWLILSPHIGKLEQFENRNPYLCEMMFKDCSAKLTQLCSKIPSNMTSYDVYGVELMK